jgi:hypothetical protein
MLKKQDLKMRFCLDEVFDDGVSYGMQSLKDD